MVTSAKRFWRQRLLIALLKLSPPGIVTLSPTVKPEIDWSSDSSRYLVPVILMLAIVYSRGGVLPLASSTSAGSIEIPPGFVVSVGFGCSVSLRWGLAVSL